MSHCCFDGYCSECGAPERLSANAFVHEGSAAFLAARGLQAGRTPWAWAALPGLYTLGVWVWRDKDDEYAIPWLRSELRAESYPGQWSYRRAP